MIVSAYERLGQAASCQLNVSSTTRLRGMCPAESNVLGASGVAAGRVPEHLGPEGHSPG